MGNQKWALWESLEHCVSSLWVCLLPFKIRTLAAVCIDKTHEYLSRAIYHLTPLAPHSYTKAIFASFLILCQYCAQHCTYIYPACQQCDFISSVWPDSSPSNPLFYLLTSASPFFHLLFYVFFFNPIGKWRTRCRCSVSSSARPSASLMSAWPLWSCPPMFWGTCHVTSYSLY